MGGAFYPPIGVPIYSTLSAFPSGGNAGDLAVAADTGNLYEWSGSAWQEIAGPGASLSLGNLDSEAASAKGANLVGGVLAMQSASGTNPGVVNNTTQSFSGNKTFAGSVGMATLILNGSSTGTLSFQGASNITSYSLVWPAAQGGVDTFLKNNGSGGLSWAAGTGGGGGVTSIGTIDTQTKNSDALTIVGTTLYAQTADDTNPGMVSTGTQTLKGNKTIDGTIAASNLSGTNTGDVTLAAFGSTPNANGATLAGQALNLQPADATHSGGLSSADWNTFNGKQAAGNYITALTGDGTAAGPGSAPLTLATVNANVGSFGDASHVPAVTVNGKGLVTAAASTSIQIAESQVTNLVSDLAGKQATGNYITALTGDVTAAGPGSAAATLATVNSNVGSFTNASVTVNGKGLVTAASSGAAPVTTLAAVGAVPNANAASISGNTLNLQPFDGTHPGVVTASGGGTANFLRADGTWSAPTSSPGYSYTAQTANYNATINDYVNCSGASFAVTLPTAVGKGGQSIWVQHNGTSLSQLYTINTTLAQTINVNGTAVGSGGFVLNTQGEKVLFTSNNATWEMTDHYTDTGWISAGGVTGYYTFATPSSNATIAATYRQAYTFTITAGNTASVGAIYSNNGNSYTLAQALLVGDTIAIFTGPADPTASGTLTYVSGTHTGGNLAFSAFVGTSTTNVYTVATTSTSGANLITQGDAAPAANTNRLVKLAGTGDAVISTTSNSGAARAVSATTTAPVFYGVPTTNSMQWRRHGNMVTVWVNFYAATAGAVSGSGDYIFPMPANMTIDTSVIPAFTGGAASTTQSVTPTSITAMWPNATGWGTGSNYWNPFTSAPYTSSSYRIYGEASGYTSGLISPGSTVIPVTQIIAYNWQVTFPISGWQP